MAKRIMWRSVLGGVALACSGRPAIARQDCHLPPAIVADPGAGGVRVTDEGLVANWYAGTGAARRPAILLLGGSEGGIGVGTARQATDLAAHGFAVLQLAYFRAPGLPDNLDMVPLEYFDRALRWIERQPGVDPARMSIVGASKGAEAALIVASRHPDIRAVVAGAPSATAWPGISYAGAATGSSWSLRGAAVPYLHYVGEQGADGIFGIYRSALATLPSHPDAAIPVARIRGKVMLVCGRSDSLWPSCPMAEMIRQARNGDTTILAYDDATPISGPRLP